MMIRTIYFCTLISGFINFSNATELNQSELKAFASQRYHVDYDLQNLKTKLDIQTQYDLNKHLSQKLLDGAMKGNVEYKVAAQMLVVEKWMKNFMQNAKVSNDKLQEMFVRLKPTVNGQYKVRSVILTKEADADLLLKTISSGSEVGKLMDEFGQKFQSKVFVSELTDSNRFDTALQILLSSRNKGESFKFQTKNKQWQVLWIEEYIASRPASFEESKEKLTLLAKQKMLDEEMKKILGK